MDQFRKKYLEEANDLLQQLEKSLLALEGSSDFHDSSSVEEIFRIMHTLKGNSSMFGFDFIGEFTHHLENIYDSVRSGSLSLTPQIISITLTSVDHLRNLLKDDQLKDANNKVNHHNLLISIREISEKKETIAHTPGKKTNENNHFTYYVKFNPGKEVFRNGTNPLYLIEDLKFTEKSVTVADFSELPELSGLSPEKCYTSWHTFIYTDNEDSLRDIFMFVDDAQSIEILKLTDQDIFADNELINKIRSSSPVYDKTVIEKIISEISDRKIAVTRNETKAVKNETEKSASKTSDNLISSLRVSSEKLDEMMRLVSELVTTQARLSLLAESHTDTTLAEIAENMEKITRRLRDNSFSICLVPLETTVTRFQRLVRDLSAQLNKNVAFITEGTETELDKTIIESISDPLMHILRNSLDHGIESEEERIKSGKPAQGKILLRAFYSGANVHIEIKDDGKGINPEKIRKKAAEKGLISADASLSEKEIFELLFMPGFSTAEKITEVSGRGVGMDVVKRQITDLRGEVELNSIMGKGTTITIKLPLTLSIIDGLLVTISTTRFVIPLGAIEKCFEISDSAIRDAFDDLIVLDGEQYPFINLREEFGITDNSPEIQQVIIVKSEEKRVGLTVDYIIGEYQAVLKPLGKVYKNIEILSGATILGDGTVALVTDPNKIIKEFSNRKMNIAI
jgi:two-component system, chemotaxis family, sensor kinase CheA